MKLIIRLPRSYTNLLALALTLTFNTYLRLLSLLFTLSLHFIRTFLPLPFNFTFNPHPLPLPFTITFYFTFNRYLLSSPFTFMFTITFYSYLTITFNPHLLSLHLTLAFTLYLLPLPSIITVNLYRQHNKEKFTLDVDVSSVWMCNTDVIRGDAFVLSHIQFLRSLYLQLPYKSHK